MATVGAGVIPKTIHQIWLGPRPRPTVMMESWKNNHPQWSYHVWTEETIDYPLENQTQYDAMKDFGGKADILRYEILKRHGGVYVDADMTCLRPLDLDLLENEFFAAFENERRRPGLVANGLVGCAAGHPVMQEMIEHIRKLNPDRLGSVDASVETGPYAFTNVIQAHDGPTRIYPSRLFYPDHYLDAFSSSAENAYSRHDWYYDYPTICLAMVIDRDTANLWRTLARYLPHIGAYCIGVDRRSAPESPAVVDKLFENLPGEVLEIDGKNSNQAWATILNAAGGLADYSLLAEPDMALYDFRRSMLSPEIACFEINEHLGSIKRPSVRIVRPGGGWHASNWPLQSDDGAASGDRRVPLEGCHIQRFDPQPLVSSRMIDEETLLLEELDRLPGDPDTLFYLGQFCEDIGDPKRAAYYYDLRAQAGGWEDQAWEACRRIARCLRSANAPWPTLEQALLRTHKMDPSRPEPLLDLGVAAIRKGDHAQAFEYLTEARALPAPEQYFYWDPRTTQMVLEYLCICGFYAGRFAEGLRAGLEALTASPTVMSRDDIMKNIGFYLDKVDIRSLGD